MRTTAAVLRAPDGAFAIEEVDIEEPGPGEVLVKLVASGMCHTDLSMRAPHRPTPYPVVLGHEGSGTIEAVGSGVSGLDVGQPVVLSYVSCGQCRQCLSAEPTYCSRMFDLNFNCCRPDGSTSLSAAGEQIGSHYFGQSSFASHAVVPARSVVPLADDRDLDILGPLGCGVQTGAGAVLNVFEPDPGQSIAIIGCGAVGLSALMAAVVSGCGPIIGVDTNESRLAKASELGATHVVDASGEAPVVEALLDATSGRGVDFTFDAVGAPGTFEAAVESLAERGTCGFVAAGGAELTAEVSPRHLLFGRTITGILEGNSIPQLFIPQLIDLQRRGRFPFDELITRFPLAEINEAEAASHAGDVIKPLLLMP